LALQGNDHRRRPVGLAEDVDDVKTVEVEFQLGLVPDQISDDDVEAHALRHRAVHGVPVDGHPDHAVRKNADELGDDDPAERRRYEDSRVAFHLANPSPSRKMLLDPAPLVRDLDQISYNCVN
jgi:hypothetical protein